MTNTLQLYVAFQIEPICETHRDIQVNHSESAANVQLTPLTGAIWKLQGHIDTFQTTAVPLMQENYASFHTIKLN